MSRLSRGLLIGPEEWPVTRALSIISLLLVGANVLGMSLAVTLFLRRMGVQALPWMYPSAALGVLFGAAFYLPQVDARPRPYLVHRFFAVFTLAPVLLWTLADSQAAVVTLFLLAYGSSQYANMQFWLVASDVVDPRAARRIFAVVNGGGSLGALTMGLLIHPLATVVRSDRLLLLWAGLMGAVWWCLTRLFARYPRVFARLDPGPGPRGNDLRTDLLTLSRVPLVVPAALTHFLVISVSIFIDYQYNRTVHATFQTEAETASFLGMVYAAESGLAMLLQLTILPRTVSRLGLIGVLRLHPFLMALPVVGMATRPGLPGATCGRATDHVLQNTLYGTTFNALFASIPGRLRGRLLACLRLLVSPLAVCAAGGVLLALQHWGYDSVLLPLIGLLLLVWTAASLALRQGYLSTLVSHLAATDGRSLFDQAADLAGGGPETAPAVAVLLQSADPDAVVLGLELLTSVDAGTELPWVFRLLDSPIAEVRRRAWQVVGASAPPEAMHAALGDDQAEIRHLAWTLVANVETAAQRLPHETDARLAAAMLARLTDSGALNADLRGWLQSEPRRAWVLQVLDQTADPDLQTLIRTHLHDEDEALRGLAIVGLPPSVERLPDYLFLLQAPLAPPESLYDRLDTLGQAALVQLLTAWKQAQEPQVKLRLLRGLARVGHAGTIADLLEDLDGLPAEVEMALVDAIQALSPGPVSRHDLRQRLETWVHASVLAALDEALRWETLQPGRVSDATVLLADDSSQRLAAHRHRVFRKLRLLVDEDDLEAARSHLEDRVGTRRERSVAAELFETLLPGHVRDSVLHLLEDPSNLALAQEAHRLHRPACTLEAILEDTLQSPDPYLQACAVFAVARLGLAAFYPHLARLEHCGDALVMETCAAWRRGV